MHKLLRTGLVGVIIMLLAVAVFIVSTAPPRTDTADLFAAAQAYQVRIIRDDFGVPHIYGARDVDTAFGLAYAHAEDDFETIQEVLLATRGMLAAVKGRGAAKTDYLVALMGVWQAIDRDYYTLLSQHTRDIAEAYAAGINLFAAQHPQQLMPYVLPVTGQDLVAGFTFKTPLFYGFDSVLGGLFGSGEPRELARQGELALQFTPEVQVELGSQGVAVAPTRSADGKTRLLVNSHQPLTGPVAWYEARLHSEEGWDIAGATFPGSPLIIHGHNRYLGWANTVNNPDLVDVFQLTLNPDNPDQYLLDGQWRDFEVHDVEILVKLLGPLRWTFSEPLYFSEHGPVLKLPHGTFALRWAGMHETRMLGQMLQMNKARNLEEFETALAIGALPSLNYVYADVAGNIGHYYNATFPRRAEGWDWEKDLPGDRSELIWRDYLPFSAIPKTRNPTSGFVFNANNTPFVATVGEGQPVPAQFSVTQGIETKMTNRAHRLRRLLDADPDISREDLRRIKYDLHYDDDLPGMQTFRAFLEQGPEPANQDLQEAFNLLRSWDGSTRRNSRSAALAVLTLQPLLDFRHRDDRADLTVSLRQAVDHLLRHFGRMDPEFGELNRLKRGELEWPLDGGPDILRAVYGDPDPEDGTLIAGAGDSYIMFVEWDAEGEPNSISVHNFGSATLDPDSPHYADQAPLYSAMREKPVYLRLEDLLQHHSRDYSPHAPGQSETR